MGSSISIGFSKIQNVGETALAAWYLKEFEEKLPVVAKYLDDNMAILQKEVQLGKTPDDVLLPLKLQLERKEVEVSAFIRLSSRFETPGNKETLSKVVKNLQILCNALLLCGDNTLIYFLGDFSASMNMSLENAKKGNEQQNSRMQVMLDRLNECLENKEWENHAQKVDLYVAGFGFYEKLDQKMSVINEENLIYEQKNTEPFSDEGYFGKLFGPTQLDQIISNRQQFRQHLQTGKDHMGGRTPMLHAFKSSFQIIRELTDTKRYKFVLFVVLSDGDPTDCKQEEVLKIANEMRQSGIIILSCFVAAADNLISKTMYADISNINLQEGAKLMFECASRRPMELDNLSVDAYLHENGWTLEDNYRLFIHANHSEHLQHFWDLKRLLISEMADKSSQQDNIKIDA